MQMNIGDLILNWQFGVSILTIMVTTTALKKFFNFLISNLLKNETVKKYVTLGLKYLTPFFPVLIGTPLAFIPDFLKGGSLNENLITTTLSGIAAAYSYNILKKKNIKIEYLKIEVNDDSKKEVEVVKEEAK